MCGTISWSDVVTCCHEVARQPAVTTQDRGQEIVWPIIPHKTKNK